MKYCLFLEEGSPLQQWKTFPRGTLAPCTHTYPKRQAYGMASPWVVNITRFTLELQVRSPSLKEEYLHRIRLLSWKETVERGIGGDAVRVLSQVLYFWPCMLKACWLQTLWLLASGILPGHETVSCARDKPEVPQLKTQKHPSAHESNSESWTNGQDPGYSQ